MLPQPSTFRVLIGLEPYLEHLHVLFTGVAGQEDVLAAHALRPGMRVLQGGVPQHVPAHGQGGVVMTQHVGNGTTGGRRRRPKLVGVLHVRFE